MPDGVIFSVEEDEEELLTDLLPAKLSHTASTAREDPRSHYAPRPVRSSKACRRRNAPDATGYGRSHYLLAISYAAENMMIEKET